MWDAIVGMRPQAVKANNKAVVLKKGDVVLYRRWLASIKPGQKKLSKVQTIGLEAAIVAFQKGNGIDVDGDFGGQSQDRLMEVLGKLYANGVFLLQQDGVLPSEAWEQLKVKGVIEINDGRDLTISFAEIDSYRTLFESIDPFAPGRLSPSDTTAFRVATAAFQVYYGLKGPTGIFTVRAQRKAQSLFWESLTADPAMNASVADPSQEVGGIDLNPNNVAVDLQKQGKGFEFPADAIDSNAIENLPELNGFKPIIIQIVPVNNLFQILGLLEEKPAPRG